LEYPLADSCVLLQPAAVDDVHMASQELFESDPELIHPPKVGETPRVVVEIDQEVEIAFGNGVTPGNGADDADIGRAMIGRDPKDCISDVSEVCDGGRVQRSSHYAAIILNSMGVRSRVNLRC